MGWTEVEGGAGTKHWKAWDSADGSYRVVDCSAIRPSNPYRLISFIHEDENGNEKFWDFATLQQAQDHVNLI